MVGYWIYHTFASEFQPIIKSRKNDTKTMCKLNSLFNCTHLSEVKMEVKWK